MLYGLLWGNLIDLDHVYYRIIGKVPWFESACSHLGAQCSWNFYPLHNSIVLTSTLILAVILIPSGMYFKKKKMAFLGWLFLGMALNIILDLIQLKTGIGF